MFMPNQSVVQAMSELKIDDRAKRSFCAEVSGFIWSDELPMDVRLRDLCLRDIGYLVLLFHRTGSILGRENQDTQEIWDTVRKQVPTWPGFLDERSSRRLRDELLLEGQEFTQSADYIFGSSDDL
jgi:hypothetical protein